ncbi:MAG: hypothetical protein FD180_4470 [Planctomycetota bacterium]|nr:MAG: hypothetical protein FD180_4470 [Planctomycetota bacterium]
MATVKPSTDPRKLLDLGSWGFWALVVLGLAGFLATTSVAAWNKNSKLHERVAGLDREIAAQDEANRGMEGEKRALTDDAAYVERMVRAQFRKLGPEEWVIDMRKPKN